MTEEEALARGQILLAQGEPDVPIAVVYWTEAHEGPGWYAYYEEYPEEGSMRVDDEVAARMAAEVSP